ncbi:unnamed protein product [Phytophthora lilii]|uniref:Unnamed protein product n=1 Tax=Phytophthora lilii TaxID=2077276 RepID=A0A9W6TVH3_9STRA|nr:unnamed protein product [Phytophthora lilii]
MESPIRLLILGYFAAPTSCTSGSAAFHLDTSLLSATRRLPSSWSSGSEVEDIMIGMRVVVNPMETPSNIGSSGPEGAFTQELLVRDAKLGASVLPIPDDIPYEVAALCEPLAVAIHGVNRANVKAGDKVVVFGCSPIGLGMLLWLVDRGVTDVIALDLAGSALNELEVLGCVQPLIRQSWRSFHPVGCRRNGQVPFQDGNHCSSHETPPVSCWTHAHERDDHHDRCGVSDGDVEVTAAKPRLKAEIASLISHRLPFQDILDGLKIAGTPSSAKVILEFY